MMMKPGLLRPGFSLVKRFITLRVNITCLKNC
jgi:hypothetical protein